MQFIKTTIKLLFFFLPIFMYAQSDYVPMWSKQGAIMDRLEIQMQTDSVLNFSAMRYRNRKWNTERVEHALDLMKQRDWRFSRVDQYNFQQVLMENLEWKRDQADTALQPMLFFKKNMFSKPFFAGVHNKNFTILAAPVLGFQTGGDNNVSANLFQNTRGIVMRGMLGEKLGFYTYFTENQERNPLYVQQWVNRFNAVPGAGLFKRFRNDAYDYLDARGGIQFRAMKGIDMQFAYDRLFIGHGFRSLILSDFAQNYLFFKINTRFWKFNYTNVFAQLTGSFRNSQQDGRLRPQKYMAMHHLDWQINKRLQIGLFEHVIFGRNNGYDWHYLNPMIFFLSAQQQVGSPDKLTLGMNVKYNAFGQTQFYGQLVINEFIANEVLNYKRGWWGNKHAAQLGVKTINLFGIDNLDAQVEFNWVRPFTFTHRDSIGDFSNYNQPLAHPLGANFREWLAVLKYQPLPKWHLQAKAMLVEQGLDSAGRNFGSNILVTYFQRPREYGFRTGSGILGKTAMANLSVSYELFPNTFLDAQYTYRHFSRPGLTTPFTTNWFSFGMRMNLRRREFDF